MKRTSWLKGKKYTGYRKTGWKLTEETKRKISKSKKGMKIWWNFKTRFKPGKLHPNWNPDREAVKKNLRNDGMYLEWTRKIKERDNWKCKINNKDCAGKLIVHHILPWRDYFELRYEINNGITLCQAHHPRKRAEEKKLVDYFKSLISFSV